MILSISIEAPSDIIEMLIEFGMTNKKLGYDDASTNGNQRQKLMEPIHLANHHQ